jgi:hypothetical protein
MTIADMTRIKMMDVLFKAALADIFGGVMNIP